MDLKELKKEVDDLKLYEEALRELDNSWLKIIRKDNSHILEGLSKEKKKEFNKKVLELKKITRGLDYVKLLNEKLHNLAHYLVELKVSKITDDKRKKSRIDKKFLRDPSHSVYSLVSEVNLMDDQVSFLEELYERILKGVEGELDLGQQAYIMASGSKEKIEQLKSLVEKQKEYLKKIGKEFVELSKN